MSVMQLDCRHGLAMLPDNSVDAILTDPPYELGFMGHAWDKTGIAYDVAMWREALRVLRPGGHMLAFSGSRTYHRMTCAIEDSGFSIRDQMMWIYGSGFPKSLDISKAIDKLLGAEREVVGKIVAAAAGSVDLTQSGGRNNRMGEGYDVTRAATLAAQLWEGWGTGLKPAHEPICVARKPMTLPTVAHNVLAHGVGGINIDACRVPVDAVADASQLRTMNVSQHDGADGWGMNTTGPKVGARVLGDEGRWPANVLHDGSPEVIAMFPSNEARFFQQCEFEQSDVDAALAYYCAKASKREKGRDNKHPTVKPVALGRYLARLICPPGGTLVDLFAGSGSFGVAARLEGFNFVGFDTCPESTAVANSRIWAVA